MKIMLGHDSTSRKLEQGECIIIPNRYRPVRGKHGTYRTVFRHGVSEIRAGERFALGIIFHDAL